ncbi:nuclear transport factor 2 family protein [Gillisia limnaea]|uniref:SnoaL-like domain-containing protein n=1 Tax=Gillisia limnaea (strain DSM 15749 / LMG 21470 / R-8282) TaxID=865937 RepID=H2BSU7_GILLR|nr:nuclear transport factor 2 family protein [Gillisia limnaea]EHQ01477.1 hypothetical protein Gilli_0775 [Gillisia limnaea DSM 15749]
MKHSKIIQTLLLFVLIALPSSTAIAQNAEVEKIHQLYINTIKSANLNNLDALYTQDASIRNSDGSMVSGLDNIKAQYKDVFSSGKYSITLKTMDEAVLDKEYIFVSGSYVYTKMDEPKMVLKGEFVNTLKKVMGDWKIYKSYRYSENTNNASVVDGLYKAFAVGDVPSVLGAMDAGIVWNEAEGNAYADGNPYIGPDAVLNGVFARVIGDHEYFTLEDIKLHEMSNNKVLATLRYNAKNKATGKAYNAEVAHLWTLRDGKIIAFQQYVDTKKLADAEKK